MGQVAVWIEALDRLEFSLGLRVSLLIEPDDAQMQVRLVEARIQFDRSAEMFDGFLTLSERRLGETKAAVSSCVFGSS